MSRWIFLIFIFGSLTLAAQTPTPLTKPAAANSIEVVLFSDFQCPFCAQFSQPFRELQTKGIDGVRTTVRFKNFPLAMHRNAQLAHRAALAAKEQGKFWEMHDLLFANQSKAQREDFVAYAKKLGLDLRRFQKDLDSNRFDSAIAADVAEGEKLGVSGTPTFFIDGKAYSGTRSFDQLQQIIVGDQRRVQALAEITDNLMSKGPADAPVTLEFFADLQSPVTQPAMKVLDEVMRKYPGSVRLQFRNFPLSFHPLAPLAHEAAMTAALQGRFWEFTAFILERQDSLREQDLIAYAATLKLDETKFADALQQHKYAARVDADLDAGLKRGIRGSPVVFVNAKRIDGVPSFQELIEIVETELARPTAGHE